MAGRPEGATTKVLRETMDLDLEGVNAKLSEAGEPSIDATTLAKRRSWIRNKEASKTRKSTPQKRAVEAPASQEARKARAPSAVPRKGTFAEFVWQQPYDLEVREVLQRAHAANIPGKASAVYKVRAKYPKGPIDAGAPKLNAIATPEALRSEAAALTRIAPVRAVPARVRSASQQDSLKKMFVGILIRLGTDQAEDILEDFREKQRLLFGED